jgi:hypothetical protein
MLHSRCQWDVVLAHYRREKGDLPFWFRGKKGAPVGRETCSVMGKETPTGFAGPTEKENEPTNQPSILKGSDNLKNGSQNKNPLLFAFVFLTKYQQILGNLK